MTQEDQHMSSKNYHIIARIKRHNDCSRHVQILRNSKQWLPSEQDPGLGGSSTTSKADRFTLTVRGTKSNSRKFMQGNLQGVVTPTSENLLRR